MLDGHSKIGNSNTIIGKALLSIQDTPFKIENNNNTELLWDKRDGKLFLPIFTDGSYIKSSKVTTSAMVIGKSSTPAENYTQNL